MSKKFTLLSDLEAQIDNIPADSIVSKTLADTDLFKAVLFGFDAGQGLSEHSVPQQATLQFISGEVEITLGEEAPFTVHPGDWIHMEPGLPHTLTAKQNTIMLLLLQK